MENVVSQYPCVIKDKLSGLYLSKGWSWGLRADKIVWVSELKKAKVYRNSSGAKNALRGSFDKHYKGPKIDIKVVEFHKEMEKEL